MPLHTRYANNEAISTLLLILCFSQSKTVF